MITWKKVGTALLVASLISSVLAPAAMAASKKKVGKIYLTIDSDIRTGRDGGDVEVTATGDNTGLYYVDSWEVTNDDGDTWSSSKPPQVDIILGVEDEEEYYFSNTSSSNFKLTLGSSSKYRFDKIKFVNAKRKDSNATLILTSSSYLTRMRIPALLLPRPTFSGIPPTTGTVPGTRFQTPNIIRPS